MIDPRVVSICAEYGVEIVDRHAYPEIGQTRAGKTLERILRRYGEDHFRMLMTTVAETANTKRYLDEAGLWAASDLIRACRGIVDTRTAEWLELWDMAPVSDLQRISRDLSGFIPQRYAIGGMMYERIVRAFGPGAAQPDLFDDRRNP